MSTRLAVPVLPGTPVRVYRNLRPGVPTWSIQAKARVPGTAGHHRWYVMAHADDLTLGKVTFRVYERGLRRVLQTGVKNVHSYALGTLLGVGEPPSAFLLQGCARVRYDPREGRPYFSSPDFNNTRVDGADAVYLMADGSVYVPVAPALTKRS